MKVSHILTILIFIPMITTSNLDICIDAICEYHFVIRRWRTMTYYNRGAAYNVKLNGTKLQVSGNSYHRHDELIGRFVSPDDVITADGFIRDIITINGQFPGPDLHVIEGAQVVVHVTNSMAMEATTVHWHGIHMQDNPYMDGAAYITQCPILPLQQFTYRFKAAPEGTHWYHSHLSAHRIDGLYGMLIVHPSIPNIPEYSISIMEWLHENAITFQHRMLTHEEYPGTEEINHDHDLMPDDILYMTRIESALMNGRGRFREDEPLPLAEFHVKHGSRYRFRVVNSGIEYPFVVSIDDHILNIVALDGHEVQPVESHFAIICAGERLDFEVNFNSIPAVYWIRANVSQEGIGFTEYNYISKTVKGIIVYGKAQSVGDPISKAKQCRYHSPCSVFNCPHPTKSINDSMKCIGVEQVRTASHPSVIAEEYGLEDPDHKIMEYFLNFGFQLNASVNAKKYVSSRVPLHQNNKDEYITPCDQQKCESKGCKCTSMLDIPFNKTIQMVLLNLFPGKQYLTHHPVHFHGHNFAVLKVGYAGFDEEHGRWTMPTKDIECYGDDRSLCAKARWTGQRPTLNKYNPPVKDTVNIPAHGYVVIRFRSINPGYWFFHCHMEEHVIHGMGIVINEAQDRHLAVPEGFPTCGDFHWSSADYIEYMRTQKLLRKHGFQSSGTTTEPTSHQSHHANEDLSHFTDKLNGPGPADMQSDDSQTITLTLVTAVGSVCGCIIFGSILPLISYGLYSFCQTQKRQ